MTKSQAIYNFFSGFGIPAYTSTSVPDDAVFPWLTYENSTGTYGEKISITASLWYHTDSEATPNAKAEEIAEAIGLGGVQIPYDDGCIWVTRGNPWCITTATEEQATKCRQLNINLDFM